MRKLLGVILIMILAHASLRAQENWGGGVDDDPLHFGFTFQYVNTEFKVFKNSNWKAPVPSSDGYSFSDSLYSISSTGTPGFGIGLVSDLKLNDRLNLRLTPNLVFADREVDYVYYYNGGNPVVKKKIPSTLIDLPLGLKLRSDRRKNFAAYILAGTRYSIDITSKKKQDNTNMAFTDMLLRNKKSFFSYEAAIGFDLYFEYFKLSPEIKFSQSFNDVLRHEAGNPYSTPIEKLLLRNIQISFHFE